MEFDLPVIRFRLFSVILSLLLCIMAYGLPACAPSSASSAEDSSEIDHDIPSLYDDDLRTASNRFIPQYEWEWLKAQCYQESLLDPRARSRAGAMGLCQFMPGTWDEVSKTLNLNASPYNPKANAIAASFYMGRLDGQWTSPRPSRERLRLAQASYNAGLGNILKAQKQCNGELFWKDIEPCLGYDETRIYVLKIGEYYELLTE